MKSYPLLRVALLVPLILETCTALAGLQTSPSHEYPEGITYASPMPGAEHTLPQATIIIRTDVRIDPAALSSDLLFQVEGTSSGSHSGDNILSDDGETIIFKPHTVFVAGETVHVRIDISQLGQTHPNRDPATFWFLVSTLGVGDPGGGRPFGVGESTMLPPVDQCCGTRSNTPSEPGSTSSSNDTLPLDFPYIETMLNGEPSPGFIFLANLRFSGAFVPYLMILDNHGLPIFYRKMSSTCYDFKMNPNGLMTYYSAPPGCFYAMDDTYTVVDSFRCGNGYTTDVHDIQLLDNGHILLMSYDPEIVDMRGLVAGGQARAVVTGLVVQELDLSRNVVFQWRSWDSFSILDATHEDLTANIIDYVHGNALHLDTDGNILVSNRHMDEITKVSRSTGRVIWRLGGKNNEFTFTNDTLGFSHQHAIRSLENGNLILFDNGNFHPTRVSRAVEFALDEVNLTATRVWEYTDPSTVYGSAMGDVQRLPNGNSFIGWGSTNPTATEIQPDGSKVFELNLAPGMFSYRAFRSALGAHVSGDDEIPGAFTLSQNYPNPFNGLTTFVITLNRPADLTFRLYDILGREVATIIEGERRNTGVYVHTIDVSGLASGVYFGKLTGGEAAATRKIVLVK